MPFSSLKLFPLHRHSRWLPSKSNTRREDLLLNSKELEVAGLIRRATSNMAAAESTEQILKVIKATKNNEDFLEKTKFSLERYKD